MTAPDMTRLVAPLEWEDQIGKWSASSFTSTARNAMGVFIVSCDLDDPNHEQLIRKKKTAAQADYAARIIAALDGDALYAMDVAGVRDAIHEITDADYANIIAHLSYELEPTGPLPNRNSLMMEVVRLRNAANVVIDTPAAAPELVALVGLLPEAIASLDATGCNASLVRDLRAALSAYEGRGK